MCSIASTGKLISAEKIGKVTWADHIDLDDRPSGRGEEHPLRDRRRPSSGQAPIGAHSWQAMSFSPRTGLVYIPYMQLGVAFLQRRAGCQATSSSAA